MSLPADCLARLKLRRSPFEETPSEDFLYSDPLLDSLVETASHAMSTSGVIVVLAGLDGSGRSVQLMRLLGSLADHFELIAFRGRADIGFAAVDATIRSHLSASGFDDPGRPLAELLARRCLVGVPLVLAIDDAHLLGAESIQALLRVRGELLESKGQGLRLVLVGDQALSRGRLPLLDPADENQVVRLNLRPFNLEQAGAYLRHRLRVAGVDDPESFLTSGDIAALQTGSKGLPAALNANANAWLARRCRGASGFKPAVAGALGAGAGAGSPAQGVAAGRRSPAPIPTTTDVDPAPTEVEGILELDATSDQLVRPDPQLAEYLVQEDVKSENPDFEAVLRRVRQHQAAQGTPAPVAPKPVAPPAAPTPYWSRRWFIPAVLLLVVLAILVPVVLQLPARPSAPATDAPVERAPTPTPTPTPTPSVEAEPGSTPGRAPTSEPPAGERPESPSAADTSAGESAPAAAVPSHSAPAAERPDQTPPPASTAGADTPAASGEPSAGSAPDEDQAWLARQDPARFTIQLAAARDLAAARSFVARHQLDGVHYIQTRSFVIVLVGSFPNRAEAQRALPDLPAAVRGSSPWIRTVGSILGPRQ